MYEAEPEFPEGRWFQTKKTFHGRGVDVFWNSWSSTVVYIILGIIVFQRCSISYQERVLVRVLLNMLQISKRK